MKKFLFIMIVMVFAIASHVIFTNSTTINDVQLSELIKEADATCIEVQPGPITCCPALYIHCYVASGTYVEDHVWKPE